MEFTFVVPGEPLPQPRQRFRSATRLNRYTGRLAVIPIPYRAKDDPTPAYKDGVRLAARLARPRDWPLSAAYRVLTVFVTRPPKRLHARLKRLPPGERLPDPTKPDADNMKKAVMDALKGELWADDGQCFDVRAVKVYAAPPALRLMTVIRVQAVEAGSVDSTLAELLSTHA